MERGGNGQSAQIEQVDEVGVGAEPAVELNRIGEHLRDGVEGRRRRQRQRVDMLEGLVRDAAQSFELIESVEGIDRADACAAQDDLARYRMHGFGRRRD